MSILDIFPIQNCQPPHDDVGDLMASFKKGAKVGGTSKIDNPPSYQQATQKVEEADLVSLPN